MAVFRFKQFEIRQEKSAMKAGTDSILLGAWTKSRNCRDILDIGTGTGVLCLMLAQKCDAFITGVEADKESAREACDNVFNSPWKNRIEIYHAKLQEFFPLHKFDHIVTNPPYFQNSLKAPDKQRTLARHNVSLTQEDILAFTSRYLLPEGKISVIWPVAEGETFIELAKTYDLYCYRKTYVRPNNEKPPHRLLLELGFGQAEPITGELTIETEKRHIYTEEYKEITKDFYLSFRE